MMRLRYLFLIWCFFLNIPSTFAQSPDKHFIATYEFSDGGDKSLLSSLIFNTLTYTLTGNSIVINLSARLAEIDENHITLNVSGSSNAVIYVPENLVMLDSNPDTLFKFDPISLSQNNHEANISGFQCKLYTSERGDSLFLSEALPYYVNPLFLNSNSLKYGVAMAKIKNLGVFTLRNLKQTSEQIVAPPIDRKPVAKVRNIFF